MLSLTFLFLVFSSLQLDSEVFGNQQDTYNIGVGIGDVTGPAAEVNMMGYAKLGQDTAGIHFRLFSRAFIIADNDDNRICFVTVDVGMIDQAVKTEVVERLKAKFGDLYTEKNVMLSGTHTHSGPGGFLQYLLYTITSQGFKWQSFFAIVEGIVRSIERAHSSMQQGYIYFNQGMLLNASINRSPSAYANNTAAERSRYEYNTDKEMYLLKFVALNNKPLGLINWFAVHPTSMNNTNQLISGDNKGYASLLFEQLMNKDKLPGRGRFVAAFANANQGDVSPNIKGPHCLSTGLPCDYNTSTCDGKNSNCIALGPGKDMFESTKIIGERQFLKAKELFGSAKTKVKGGVAFIHQHVDMSKVKLDLPSGEIKNTCKPAMGYSFAAGTVDGPGAFDFKQGATSSNEFWNAVRDFISKPSNDMIECHKPKPILLATGQMTFPYQWQPDIVPTQLFRIGNIVIVGVPAEFTTMSGRRLRSAVKRVFESNINAYNDLDSNQEYQVIISGLSNAYSSYVATYEEYQIQRYEGASTIYGPYTLDAYIKQYVNLSNSLIKNETIDSGPDPPNLLSKQISLRPGVVFDTAPIGKNFGDCISQVEEEYKAGSTVTVKFISGHPQNDLKTESTYLTVEMLLKNGTYKIIATDSNLETKFFWRRTNALLGRSEVTITWDIPLDAKPAYYRIKHFGAHKNLIGHVKPYSGQTNLFKVVAMR